MRSKEMSDEEIGRLGVDLYNRRLRGVLEPTHDGKAVVIAIEDGDYEVAETHAEADARLRARHPEAVFFYGRVGGDHAVRWSSGYPHVTTGKP